MINRDASTDLALLRRLADLGLRPGSIYDIGASNGVWTEESMTVFPDAFYDLFEPLFSTAPEYGEAVRQNRPEMLANPSVRIHQMAVGSEEGEIEMTVFPNHVGSTSLPIVGEPRPGARKLRVPVTTVDRCVSERGLPSPDIIKMDTQGGELEILKGAVKSLPYCTALFLECWIVKSYQYLTPMLDEICAFLRPFDFYIWEFGDPFRDANGNLAAIDVVFLNARNRISPLHGWRRSRERARGGAR